MLRFNSCENKRAYLKVLLDVVANLRGKANLLEILSRHLQQFVKIGHMFVNRETYSHAFFRLLISAIIKTFKFAKVAAI